jgi:predicted GH43/DUF377 family glycosyl hydrolase
MEDQQSLPTFIDLDRNDPARVLYIHDQPVLDFGRKGTFDENGIMPSSALFHDGKVLLYYLGWSQCRNVPNKNFNGLAVSMNSGKTFTKIHEAPVIPVNEFNPIGTTNMTVIYSDNSYYAYYSSITKWIEIDEKLESTYLMTYATSKDGIQWQPSGKMILEPCSEFEAQVRPAIINIGSVWHMWFSYRGSHGFRQGGENAYHIGYATSKDLINWERNDKLAGIEASESGWDSQMICYPAIVQVGGKKWMFYNGNGFGKSGFGYAELEL